MAIRVHCPSCSRILPLGATCGCQARVEVKDDRETFLRERDRLLEELQRLRSVVGAIESGLHEDLPKLVAEVRKQVLIEAAREILETDTIHRAVLAVLELGMTTSEAAEICRDLERQFAVAEQERQLQYDLMEKDFGERER